MNRNTNGFQFGNNPPQFNQQLNVSTNHPLIPFTDDYFVYKKYVSIHSEDRDMIRFPNSSQFEIELPEDITNVYKLALTDWTFPANYNTFSVLNENVFMTFKISAPYNPNALAVKNDLASAIFEALYLFSKDYSFFIDDGFYNPSQMSTTLTNKFNEAVSNQILAYFKTQIDSPPDPLIRPAEYWETLRDEFISSGQYKRFVIVYNDVGQKFWFGNIADGFILTNESIAVYNAYTANVLCGVRIAYKEFASWGLPCNLGLSRCNITAKKGYKLIDGTEVNYTPRFYYGDVFSGDDGYWLTPSPELPGSFVYYIEAEYKINLMGYSHFYMEIEGQNCIDETSPYNPSEFTFTRPNTTNGVVNSAFAKIAVPTTPITQWFDRNSLPFKFYDPPAEKIRKLSIRIRYHNNQLVNFGAFNFSFTLEFTQMLNQIKRGVHIVNYTPGG